MGVGSPAMNQVNTQRTQPIVKTHHQQSTIPPWEAQHIVLTRDFLRTSCRYFFPTAGIRKSPQKCKREDHLPGSILGVVDCRVGQLMECHWKTFRSCLLYVRKNNQPQRRCGVPPECSFNSLPRQCRINLDPLPTAS